eukprot:TRINITY_DN14972_c0_g1_i4.p1 TRINITY_DN14972_c0_g1~~TRINITY_DN14972_c0_g1_i4.p1  ORF type:complete len:591 (+),score=37.81 TRINITY_DN14972_c0_g1_i4:377-2149(+)
MVSLAIEGASLTGTVDLRGLPKLQFFTLMDSPFSGWLDLADFPVVLDAITICRTLVSGTIDLTLPHLHLSSVQFEDNKLSGTIDVSQLPESCSDLSLGGNLFSGTLRLAGLTSLRKLNVSSNRLTRLERSQSDYLPPSLQLQGNPWFCPLPVLPKGTGAVCTTLSSTPTQSKTLTPLPTATRTGSSSQSQVPSMTVSNTGPSTLSPTATVSRSNSQSPTPFPQLTTTPTIFWRLSPPKSNRRIPADLTLLGANFILLLLLAGVVAVFMRKPRFYSALPPEDASVGATLGDMSQICVSKRPSGLHGDFPALLTDGSNEWKTEPGFFLGKGGFGVVVRGSNTVTGELVAIKRILAEEGPAAEAVRREIARMAKLIHPNIVQYLGSVHPQLDGLEFFIIMELAESGSLHQRLKDLCGNPLPSDSVRLIACDIAHGLAFLHDRFLLHRDIKPRNILLSRNGTAKLADFGISTDQLSKSQAFRGSVMYAPPETLLQGKLSLAVDIWAFGWTILESLTAVPPWPGAPPPACGSAGALPIIRHIMTNDPMVPQDHQNVSPDAYDLIFRCLLRDPTRRPTAHEILAHPFMCVRTTNQV